MSSYQSFNTERLLLKPTTEEDAGFILELLNTPKWLKNIGDRKVKTVDDASIYIQTRMKPQLEKLGYSNYTVIRKADGVKMGVCGLYKRDGLDGIDIGFAFLPEYEQRGYAFESASRLMKAAFHDFKITQVSAVTTKENLQSQKLIEKLGLRFARVVKLPDDDEELLLYQCNC